MWLKLYSAYLAAASLFAFCLYAADKNKAKRGAWRVRESVLLCVSFFGGGIGGYLAMWLTRHKIRKAYFHLAHIVAIAWQLSLLLYLIKTAGGLSFVGRGGVICLL